ncbi:Na+/H+ antiporter NhaA [Myxococcus sp. RHSTA-1-4]|uniref:Na+/H+ antiporter NhaA n=1 Tax=Myxococcus sp. RHSTA-1-4 TaxID=2874601 RepID=UPI001CBFFDCC|nr:Na+/H+ antiporter NhaA [Myxococcus sp. RHSTA-1-4]MBZ4421626.1 Na+/H+ antiporter NhaA [Myxococcus sp. RHSTA-1-4]
MSTKGSVANRKLGSLFAGVVRPIQRFFELEAASGILLLAAAAAALIWANSPWSALYTTVFDYPLSLGAGGAVGRFTVRVLINDGLMTLFFFVVGMEIKRELVVGELRTPSRALLPLFAAVGGMLVPAGIYVLLNRGGPGQPGWAIPMATDIAFCIGILTLLKSRVPHPLIVFLTALAIFDDMGGILVIALFYGSGLHLDWLLVALGVTGALFVCNRLRVANGLIWAAGGAALWYALHHGGIHATLAGVVLGLMIPSRPLRSASEVLAELHAHTTQLMNKPADEDLENAEVLAIEEKLEDLEPPLNRFVHLLHPYMAFFIMPVFALANSGVSLSGVGLSDLANPIPLGAMLGLFLGKQLGIFAATFAAVRLGMSPVPGNASWVKVYGVCVVAGIGFTVALFIAGLAFPEPRLLDEAKVGILLGSALSGIGGYLLLRMTAPVIGTREAGAPAPSAAPQV